MKNIFLVLTLGAVTVCLSGCPNPSGVTSDGRTYYDAFNGTIWTGDGQRSSVVMQVMDRSNIFDNTTAREVHVIIENLSTHVTKDNLVAVTNETATVNGNFVISGNFPYPPRQNTSSLSIISPVEPYPLSSHPAHRVGINAQYEFVDQTHNYAYPVTFHWSTYAPTNSNYDWSTNSISGPIRMALAPSGQFLPAPETRNGTYAFNILPNERIQGTVDIGALAERFALSPHGGGNITFEGSFTPELNAYHAMGSLYPRPINGKEILVNLLIAAGLQVSGY